MHLPRQRLARALTCGVFVFAASASAGLLVGALFAWTDGRSVDVGMPLALGVMFGLAQAWTSYFPDARLIRRWRSKRSSP